MQPVPFNITPAAVTVVVDGQPKTFQKGTAAYAALTPALLAEDWDAVATALKPDGPLAAFLIDHGLVQFSIKDNVLHFGDDPVHDNVRTRIERMLVAGEDPHRLLRFYERLQENPSRRSVTQLYDFLQHTGIAIEPDGTFLAYKGVQRNMKDVHSGTVDNTPGVINEMPRNKISDDPNTPCHYGYHVGALEYAGTFGGSDNVVIICRVDPKDVVCVPYDYSSQKMRVCKYEVVGFHNGEKMGDSETVEEPPVADKNEPKTNVVPCANCERLIDKDFYFCHGCQSVICDECDQTNVAGFEHDVSEHLDANSPEPGSHRGEREEPEDLGEKQAVFTQPTAPAEPEVATFDGPIALDESELRMARSQNLIGAVKSLRGRLGCSLKEAVDAARAARDGATSMIGTDTVRGVVDAEPEPKQPKTVPAKRLGKLTPAQLMNESLDTLRAYASFVKVFGASHLKGGKTALVPLIVKARKKLGHKHGKKRR